MTSRRAAIKACAHALFGVGIAIAATGAPAADPAVIELTQVPCQFLEPEGGTNHGFQSSGKKDCVAINAETEAARLAKAKTIRLRPGKYIFRVTNLNVDYELGFWLRGDGLLDRLSLPSVSGGGLKAGTTQDYEIVLEEGEYVYSCPRNPTPAYKLIVK